MAGACVTGGLWADEPCILLRVIRQSCGFDWGCVPNCILIFRDKGFFGCDFVLRCLENSGLGVKSGLIWRKWLGSCFARFFFVL